MSRRDLSMLVPDITNLVVDGINWQTIDTHTPGGCPLVEWCEGQHPMPTETTQKVFHARPIGSAMPADSYRGDLLVEVVVAQWKAAPGVEWIDGASGPGWPNRDKAPQVGIFTFPADGPGDGLWLDERPWGAPLASILRGLGEHPFAELLDIAVQFAHKLDEETKR